MPYRGFGISTRNIQIDEEFESQVSWDVVLELEDAFVGDMFWHTADEISHEVFQSTAKRDMEA